MSGELERVDVDGEVVEPGLGDYVELVDVGEVLRRVAAGLLVMSAVVELLETNGVAPAACRALRMVVPRVDFARVSRGGEAS